ILINKCYDIRKHYAGLTGLEEIEELSGEDPCNPELKEAIASLGETYSIVMTLYYGMGYSSREIAEILGISPGAVRVRLKRGRQKLKEYYDADR
ncbi:MAG: sigma-70 family RNA polymerase sigma factor, partial [Parasporobacterium sp.]|nr:sigma-70 family RNA polymerase sigma factor [Parasporobacterium sp.]